MTSFLLSLAGISIRVNALYASTEQFCRSYLTSEPPLFSVTVRQQDIDLERDRSAQEDALEGIPVRQFRDPYLETLAVYRKIADRLLDYDVLLFHGSVVAVENRAFLFTARSGVGKTTHTRLWLKNIPGAYVVNGDKPLLKVTGQGVIACGSPWQGKENYGTNAQVPLQAVVLLERSPTNQIVPLEFAQALPGLLQQSYRPQQTEGMLKSMELAGKLGQQVALYRLGCNMEDEAASVAWNALGAEEGIC